ncbi:MAG: hypothetical protein KDC18_12235 [Alphaproteobacteria bacterium]|nr:hypothetical protein [Alphaproteobacteria bacterium]MCB9931723.1 hypothetical protein [Alphaproteobacteria bacterium]
MDDSNSGNGAGHDQPNPMVGFTHLFGPPAPSERYRGLGNEHANAAMLKKLANVIGTNQVRSDNAADWANNSIPAGYTYLAQLVGHDLVNTALSSYELTGVERPIWNTRPASLGLETILAHGPSTARGAFGAHPRSEAEAGHAAACLRLEPAREGAELTGPLRDLPRTKRQSGARDAVASLCVDPRNDTNAVLSQLTVAFSLFYNMILAALARIDRQGQLKIPPEFGTQPTAAFQFDEAYRLTVVSTLARHVVAHVYRRIIRCDLMNRLLNRNVYNFYSSEYDNFIDKSAHTGTVTYEFAHAAGRIGHAMVRPEYKFRHNQNSIFTLEESLSRSPIRGHFHLPLTKNWLVDWGLFFPFTCPLSKEIKPAVNASAKIRPHATLVMSTKLSIETTKSAYQHYLNSLLGLDFMRGNVAELRSVASIADIIVQRGPSRITENSNLLRCEELRKRKIGDWLQAAPGGSLLDTDEANCIASDPPLLFYILLEADIEAKGERLGTLGSVVVAETIFRALSRHERIAGRNAAAQEQAAGELADQIFGVVGGSVPTTMPDMLCYVQRALPPSEQHIPLVDIPSLCGDSQGSIDDEQSD